MLPWPPPFQSCATLESMTSGAAEPLGRDDGQAGMGAVALLSVLRRKVEGTVFAQRETFLIESISDHIIHFLT